MSYFDSTNPASTDTITEEIEQQEIDNSKKRNQNNLPYDFLLVYRPCIGTEANKYKKRLDHYFYVHNHIDCEIKDSWITINNGMGNVYALNGINFSINRNLFRRKIDKRDKCVDDLIVLFNKWFDKLFEELWLFNAEEKILFHYKKKQVLGEKSIVYCKNTMKCIFNSMLDN